MAFVIPDIMQDQCPRMFAEHPRCTEHSLGLEDERESRPGSQEQTSILTVEAFRRLGGSASQSVSRAGGLLTAGLHGFAWAGLVSSAAQGQPASV